MKSWRKKPVVVEAVQWDGTVARAAEIALWVTEGGGEIHYRPGTPLIQIVTLEGVMDAPVGWWIIRGVQGEFYPCDPSIFEATYNDPEDDPVVQVRDMLSGEPDVHGHPLGIETLGCVGCEAVRVLTRALS